ncbi:hypothetical protein [uncultured Gilliamella sp.]|uniref:hypothetical protein n=1 Tax=uncultured Gilliamella sp. TaxID=1193505 RepID=UPI0025D8B46F|nr:hypothetical protein [uncultured Gilliamella sp.]
MVTREEAHNLKRGHKIYMVDSLVDRLIECEFEQVDNYLNFEVILVKGDMMRYHFDMFYLNKVDALNAILYGLKRKISHLEEHAAYILKQLEKENGK